MREHAHNTSPGLGLLRGIVTRQQQELRGYAGRPNPSQRYIDSGNALIQELVTSYNLLEQELAATGALPDNTGRWTMGNRTQGMASLALPRLWEQAGGQLAEMMRDGSLGAVMVRIDLGNGSGNIGYLHLNQPLPC